MARRKIYANRAEQQRGFRERRKAKMAALEAEVARLRLAIPVATAAVTYYDAIAHKDTRQMEGAGKSLRDAIDAYRSAKAEQD